MLFPKVQFVITTHAPLFLLGMKETYGEDHFEAFELPTATRIDIESYAEFQKAYEYIKETESYQKDVKKALESIQSNGIVRIITEGSTDWKHLKAAYNDLKSRGVINDLREGFDFEFLEYEPLDSIEDAKVKLNMGDTVLREVCDKYSMWPQPNKYIFIADRDNKTTIDKLSNPGKNYKSWGNNVYSFTLPIPSHRVSTPDISIEHYYTDDEIKTEWYESDSEIKRRLYMGNEFDERGVASKINRFCEHKKKCGITSIAIIDGSSGERVTSLDGDKSINYALPKSKFAKMILEKQAPFDRFSFDSFKIVFEIIKEIINND